MVTCGMCNGDGREEEDGISRWAVVTTYDDDGAATDPMKIGRRAICLACWLKLPEYTAPAKAGEGA